jgi:Flp pilus assembly protein TadD
MSFRSLARLVSIGLTLAALSSAAVFDLRFDRLTDAVRLLPDADQSAVDNTIQLIRQGDHSGALERLSELNRKNPENSSLRILTAYAMLQLGNLAGAFDQANRAHEASNGGSYRCWFFAKVAFLTGQTAVCERELKHARNAGDLPEEVKSLQQDLKNLKQKKK